MEAAILRIGLALVANAIALLVAALLLGRLEIEVTTFVWVVLLFTAISLVVEALVRGLARPHPQVTTWAVSLLTTFLALLILDLASDSLQIEGVGTWILATVIVWLVPVGLALIPGPWQRAGADRRGAPRETKGH